MALGTTLGTYFLPFASRSGDQTAKTVEILVANTAGGAADADHTLTAFAVSGTSAFMVDYVMLNVLNATTTARYELLIDSETITSFSGKIDGGESVVRELDWSDVGGLQVTGQTSTTPVIVFVSSNAAATAGSKILTAKGHWA